MLGLHAENACGKPGQIGVLQGHVALDALHIGGDTRCLQVIQYPEERPGLARVPQRCEGHGGKVEGPVR